MEKPKVRSLPVILAVDGDRGALPLIESFLSRHDGVAKTVIFLTSRRAPQDYKTGHDLGAVICMVKPIKTGKLLNVVQMLTPVHA